MKTFCSFYSKHYCTSSRIHRAQVIKNRHRTHASAVQSTKRVPSRLRSVAFWESLLLHILHNENEYF